MTENKTPITLRVGGVYRSRDGYTYGPIYERTMGNNYPFTDCHHTWRKDGGFRKNGTSPMDLISEITPAPHRSSLIYGAAMVGDVPVPATWPPTMTAAEAEAGLVTLDRWLKAQAMAAWEAMSRLASLDSEKIKEVKETVLYDGPSDRISLRSNGTISEFGDTRSHKRIKIIAIEEEK